MLLARDILLHTAPLILGAAKDIKAHIKIKFLFEAYDLIIDYNMASNQASEALAHPFSVT